MQKDLSETAMLEAGFSPIHFRDDYLGNPLLSREGNNVTIPRNGKVTEHEGILKRRGRHFSGTGRESPAGEATTLF